MVKVTNRFIVWLGSGYEHVFLLLSHRCYPLFTFCTFFVFAFVPTESILELHIVPSPYPNAQCHIRTGK